MSLKVSAEDIIPCIHRFLVKFGHTAAAKALEKSADVEPVIFFILKARSNFSF